MVQDCSLIVVVMVFMMMMMTMLCDRGTNTDNGGDDGEEG